ncbi:MAG TPA: hypothetical protein VKP30_15140, partial [Polyangiaceae bacterium]|nr:hypothetical protein [Polyangiaceae bacterium]
MTDSTRNPEPEAGVSEPAPLPQASLTLEEHARISAEIAEGDLSEAELLKRHGVSQQQWNDATLQLMTALAEDAQKNGAEATLALLYSEQFGAHQQSLKPSPDMTPEQWEELQFDIERSDGPDIPLAQRHMSMADYLRLVRVFAKRITEEPEVALRVQRRRAELESS